MSSSVNATTPVTGSSSSKSETSYTTFTSLCETTINGTVTSVPHTHSQPVSASSSSLPITTSIIANTSHVSSSSYGPTAIGPETSSGSYFPTTSRPANSTEVSPVTGSTSTNSSKSETSYTTFTSLCETTINGTVTSVPHTHSQPISPSGYSYPTTSSGANTSYVSSSSNGPTAVGPETSSGSYSPTSFAYSPSVTSSSASATSTNATCSGATLNVLGASLDWWYTSTYVFAVSTFSVQFDSNDVQTGWTLLPATTTFDVSSALAGPVCEEVPVTYSSASATLDVFSCFTTPGPVAAATTVVPQVAYTTPNASTGTGFPPNVVITPAPPSITIPSSGGAFQTGTPFVYFSAYEIMSKYPTTYDNGSSECAATTKIYNMSSPFSFEYTGPPVNGSLLVGADVTGDVNPAFLNVVNQTKALAGSWVAAPTVAVVVQNVFAVEAVLAAHTETSAASLLLPSATIPSYLTPAPTTTALGVQTPAPVTNHVESTATYLELPTQSTVNTGGQVCINEDKKGE